jgi:hypothetical protein
MANEPPRAFETSVVLSKQQTVDFVTDLRRQLQKRYGRFSIFVSQKFEALCSTGVRQVDSTQLSEIFKLPERAFLVDSVYGQRMPSRCE